MIGHEVFARDGMRDLTDVAQVVDWAALAQTIKAHGRQLGFQAVAVSDTDLSVAEPALAAWLAAGCHGDMDYMARHGSKRTRPDELHAGTVRIITARMNYWPEATVTALEDCDAALADSRSAYISRYALGRDYHKLMRARLQRLAERIDAEARPLGHAARHRVFTDSAPVMEVELARKSGLGWRGKNTLLLSRDAGSYFFLGEIYTDLPLPADAPVEEHCGTCTRCISACPTGAIVAPYKLDARRCISYLTIELKGSIPVELRPLIGNRVYGCDDCQLVCPWNSFAQTSAEDDFRVRNGLDHAELVELFGWSEAQFNQRLAGSAIRRIGHERWLRNIAVAMGNALRGTAAKADKAASMVATAIDRNPAGVRRIDSQEADALRAALRAQADHPSALVREHVAWALQQNDNNLPV
jgi:epoxyqueuosine reductase